METIKFWWKTVIWYPLDIADRILVLVGAISGFLQKGDSPMTINLAWQIPSGAIIVLLIWRLMQAPVKIIDNIRRERRGEQPLTLESIGQQIKKIQDTLGKLQERIEPQRTFDSEGVKEKISFVFKRFDDSNIGGITRSATFVFEVTNASQVWVNATGNTKGEVIFLANRLMGVYWQVESNEIAPGKRGTLILIFPVSEKFAQTLAFKPEVGSFYADFSGMSVEFEAWQDNHPKLVLGFIPIGGETHDIPIRDHPAYQEIRKIVEWKQSLGKDDRITR